MIKKILIFNYTGCNMLASSLIEGLKLNKNIKVFSTTKSNYGSDIVINSKRLYSVSPADGVPPQIHTTSIVSDSDKYITECQNLMEECDLVVIFDDKERSTAYFYSIHGIKTDLHEYALQHHKDKVVMIDAGDWSSPNYGTYSGSHPAYFKVYFKREKNLDDKYPNNVEPLPFASEERHFTLGKNFDSIWKDKNLNVSCLFRCDPTGERIRTKEALNNRYRGNDTFVLDNVFGRKKNDGIDEELEGAYVGECVRHHHYYYDILSKVKISVDAMPDGSRAFYTGRMMESLANGCLVFYPTLSYNIDFPNGLIDGEDYIIYNGPADLIDKIEYYLSHENEMRTIAENGFNKLLKYHTSEARAKEFIETCERYME